MLRATWPGSEQVQSSSKRGFSFSKKRALSRASAYALVRLCRQEGGGGVGLVHVRTHKTRTHDKQIQHMKRNRGFLGKSHSVG